MIVSILHLPRRSLHGLSTPNFSWNGVSDGTGCSINLNLWDTVSSMHAISVLRSHLGLVGKFAKTEMPHARWFNNAHA